METSVARTAAAPPPARSSPPAELRRLVVAHGGFTLDRQGRRVRQGTAVCTDPAGCLSFHLHRWDDGVVARWLATRASGEHVGGWCDPLDGLVWLDVVRVLPDHHRHRAFELARRHGQRAVFDLTRGTLIRLGDPAGWHR